VCHRGEQKDLRRDDIDIQQAVDDSGILPQGMIRRRYSQGGRAVMELERLGIYGDRNDVAFCLGPGKFQFRQHPGLVILGEGDGGFPETATGIGKGDFQHRARADDAKVLHQVDPGGAEFTDGGEKPPGQGTYEDNRSGYEIDLVGFHGLPVRRDFFRCRRGSGNAEKHSPLYNDFPLLLQVIDEAQTVHYLP